MKSNIIPLSPKNYDELLALWESSVRATHHFLKESYLQELKPLLKKEYFPSVSLYGIKDESDHLVAFLGCLRNKIEMLFVHPDAFGKGLGKTLIRYAVDELKADSVDVNEQNEQAVGFYLHQGFKIIGRDETDSEGKPYPILHLSL
ncbi:MAG: GNAT family N-acetyltransferase [Bacteroides sp.]|nr:GNAT family N-acetyltransferase [Bacteroides sp.]